VSEFEPAVVYPMRDTIIEEMFARDWSPLEIARRMGGDSYERNVAVLELIFAEPDFDTEYVCGLLLGEETAAQLETAFGISAEFWLRTDEMYRKWRQAR
jgi:hypothetical protein